MGLAPPGGQQRGPIRQMMAGKHMAGAQPPQHAGFMQNNNPLHYHNNDNQDIKLSDFAIDVSHYLEM